MLKWKAELWLLAAVLYCYVNSHVLFGGEFSQKEFSADVISDVQVLLKWQQQEGYGLELQRQIEPEKWLTLWIDIPPYRNAKGYFIDVATSGSLCRYRLIAYKLEEKQNFAASVGRMDGNATSRHLQVDVRGAEKLILKTLPEEKCESRNDACWGDPKFVKVNGGIVKLTEKTPILYPEETSNLLMGWCMNWSVKRMSVNMPWDLKPEGLKVSSPSLLMYDLTGDDLLLFETYCGMLLKTKGAARFSIAALSKESTAQIIETEISLPFSRVSPGNTTYYIDSENGDNAKDGCAPERAWKTLSEANRTTFAAGDKLLLKRGGTWDEPLLVNGCGDAGRPLLVSAYGSGEHPVIRNNGFKANSVTLRNSKGNVCLEDLEISNQSTVCRGAAVGVSVESHNFGKAENITLRNLFIHDIEQGDQYLRPKRAAVHFDISGREKKGWWDGVLIEGCIIKNTTHDGIRLRSIYDQRNEWTPSENVVIRNNKLYDIGLDGIVVTVCRKAKIEHNYVCGAAKNTIYGNPAAGIWPWSSDDTLIQYNEVCHTGYNGDDGQAFDADFNCQGTVFQYNHSHDNPNGAFLCCCNESAKGSLGNINPVIRYNLSVNDGSKKSLITASGNCKGVQLTGNLFINDGNVAFLQSRLWQGKTYPAILAQDNVFVTKGIFQASYIVGDGFSTNNVNFVGNRINAAGADLSENGKGWTLTRITRDEYESLAEDKIRNFIAEYMEEKQR